MAESGIRSLIEKMASTWQGTPEALVVALGEVCGRPLLTAERKYARTLGTLMQSSGDDRVALAILGLSHVDDSIPVGVLCFLADHEDWRWQKLVARYGPTPTTLLERLGAHRMPDVRREVAKHSNTPIRSLKALAEDSDFWTRQCVAENPRTPREVLARLADDDDEDVRAAIAANPNTPAEALTRIGEADCWWDGDE